MHVCLCVCVPGSTSGKESTCQYRRYKRHGFDPWVRKIPWSKKCIPFQYSCLENATGRGTWRSIIHWATMSQTRPSDEHTFTYMYVIYYIHCMALVFQSSLFICVQEFSEKIVMVICINIYFSIIFIGSEFVGKTE